VPWGLPCLLCVRCTLDPLFTVVAVVLEAPPCAWVEAAVAELPSLCTGRSDISAPSYGRASALLWWRSWSAGSCRVALRRLAGSVGGLASAPHLPNLLPCLRGAAPRAGPYELVLCTARAWWGS
jgi:hypothetical protein